MNAAPTIRYTDAQRREAADWFMVIRNEDDLQAGTLQAWLRWLEGTEGNRLAFEGVAQAWHATPTGLIAFMPTAAEIAADRYDGDQPLDEWLSEQPVRRAAGNKFGRRNRRLGVQSKWWAWAAAASVAVLAVGLVATHRFPGMATISSEEFVTKTGEQFEITLADGSHVWLGAKSRLLVAFTKERRGVRLDSGEAFFAVRKDHARPFTVDTPNGDITAVGTAFDVRALADRLTVAVTEGVVSVGAETQAALRRPADVRVASGQQITIEPHEPHQPVAALVVTQSASPGERSRWREGVLIYRDEPLRDVVADVARYSDRQLEIADDAVGDLHFSGVVYKSAVDEWATALPESFPVTLISEGSRLTIKSR